MIRERRTKILIYPTLLTSLEKLQLTSHVQNLKCKFVYHKFELKLKIEQKQQKTMLPCNAIFIFFLKKQEMRDYYLFLLQYIAYMSGSMCGLDISMKLKHHLNGATKTKTFKVFLFFKLVSQSPSYIISCVKKSVTSLVATLEH